MPNPKSLQVGDLVRFVSLPDEWSRPDYAVPRGSIAFMKRMMRRSWPSRVYKIDERGYPWVSARTCERGKWKYHTWMIAESSGWRHVKRKGRKS